MQVLISKLRLRADIGYSKKIGGLETLLKGGVDSVPYFSLLSKSILWKAQLRIISSLG